MSKKEIELLEKIVSECDLEVGKNHPFPNEPLIYNRPCHRCSNKDYCFVIEAIEVIAELKDKPPEGEFTKGIRHKLLDVALYCGGVEETAQVFQDLRETCVRLDQQAVENEQLKKLANYGRHKEGCNPKPWENECKCGFLKALRKANNV